MEVVAVNSADPDLKAKKKKNQGRIKIAIQRIENKSKKHVTFSKRKRGLFKKASELCILCDAKVAIITFSEAGKVYSFGHPTTDAVVHCFLGGAPSENTRTDLTQSWWDRPIENLGFAELQSYAQSLVQLRSDVGRRIADFDFAYQPNSKAAAASAMKMDYDYDFDPVVMNQATGMTAIGGYQMSDYFNTMNEVGVGDVDPIINFISPDYLSMAPLPNQDLGNVQKQNGEYYGYGYMGDESVVMTSFNREGFGDN